MSTNDPSPLSFARDIRPMFTDVDVTQMKLVGIDLSSKDDVAAHADGIYGAVSEGTMPPDYSGEPPWTPQMCARFKAWQAQGCPA